MDKEVTVGTIVQYQQRSNEDRHQRWARLERAELSERYSELHAQGVSQRQAAEVLAVPRSTLQAWRAYQERLDACPAVVAFFQSVPGLAFLHRLILAIHLVCTEVGACGMRLVCLLLRITGLNRFVGASYTYCICCKKFSSVFYINSIHRGRGKSSSNPSQEISSGTPR